MNSFYGEIINFLKTNDFSYAINKNFDKNFDTQKICLYLTDEYRKLTALSMKH